MARLGFGLSRKELLLAIQEKLNQLGEDEPRFGNDNLPCLSWYQKFMIRHPELTTRSPSLLGIERALVTVEAVDKWFDTMVEYINKIDPELLNDPTRLFNADETGFALCGKTKRVLAPKAYKGDRHLYKVSSSTKAQVTTLCCCSAAGDFVPPMIVMPGQRLSVNPAEHFKECAVGLTESGWMTGELFSSWLENVFAKYLDEHKIQKPVVLFIDGSATHSVSLGIIPYCLLANATHILQPLDLCFFGSMKLKSHWNESVARFMAENPGKTVTKAAFAGVFKTAHEKATTKEIGKRGFEKSGIFPLDKGVVLNSQKMQPSQVLREQTTPTAPPNTPLEIPSPTPIPSTSTTPPNAPLEISSPSPIPSAGPTSPTACKITSPTPNPSTGPTSSPSTTEETLNKLHVLESFMPPDVREKYERRLVEGCDLTDDVMFNAWRQCKCRLLQSSTTATSTSTTVMNTDTPSTSTTASTSSRIPMNIHTYIQRHQR